MAANWNMERTWEHNRSRLKEAGNRRGGKVFGHIAEVEATLQDKGWEGIAATLWQDPEGQQWSIDDNDKYLKHQLLEACQRTVTAQPWERASKASQGQA